MQENTNNKLIFQATVDDIAKAFAEHLKSVFLNLDGELKKEHRLEKKYVYGVKGLAKLLGCSQATAQRIKSSGRLDEAIFQDGHTIVIDSDLALELMKRK